ncbi:cobalt transporter CbiM [Vibrio panuliri]|uniref:Cobalamin biosynthesis protein CbiM n=1 Tax=Vibrio panuliri TaxID=1381081 RepID=A0ABX3F7Y5_9VIBR|nr:cobalt transporter CbiM [Vibrio panuliri]KAB1454012.1 cobalt transporter CbiM [Vibrio panuliri]OLQ84426.1 cobalamin biosynthesis protein CbiM [Vibrio panuliri]
MHIVDGVLSIPVVASGIIVSVVGTVIGLRHLTDDKVPQAAMLAACFFVASLVHIPVGPSSVHLIFNGLIGLLLGWSVFPVVLVGLILQAVFFGFGGILVLGVNTLNIALPAVVVGVMLKPYIDKWPPSRVGFLAGFLAVFLTSVLVSIALVLSGDVFVNSASLVIITHLPIALLEGFVCAYAFSLLKKVRPELVKQPCQSEFQ